MRRNKPWIDDSPFGDYDPSDDDPNSKGQAMHPLTAYHQSIWLAEPIALQRVAAKVLSFKTCFTPREVAEARQAERERMQLAIESATPSRGIDDPAEVHAESSKAIRAVKGKIGLIPIHGPVEQHLSSELMKAGGTALDWVSQGLDKMLANEQIGAIVLHMDCPGGVVYGVQELSDKIFAGRDRKPIYSMVDSMACSAGYWIATAATMTICTPGGDVGSVGVYIMHVDHSMALEAEGVKVTMVHAGKHKVEMAPYAPLTEEAKGELQSRVDTIEEKFHAALRHNRATTLEDVRSNYGQGRVVAADKALKLGMIDRIMTFDALMSKLTGGVDAAVSSRGPSAEILQLQAKQHQRNRGY